MQKPVFQKFVFNSGAAALRGKIRKPVFQDLGRQLAISTYAGSPSNIRCTNAGFKFDSLISYQSATTSIVTTESGDFFECEAIAQVIGLNVFGRLSIGEVTSRLRAVYDRRGYPGKVAARVSPAGSVIKNLEIDQKPLALKLPAAFTLSDQQANEFLYGQTDNDEAFRPDVKLIPEPFAIQNFGTIYYAEWTSAALEEGHQILTMVRLALGSDQGGDADVGCTDSDGTPYPPPPPSS